MRMLSLLLLLACRREPAGDETGIEPIDDGQAEPSIHADCTVDIAVDRAKDGTVEQRRHLVYDAFGGLLHTEDDNDADGDVETAIDWAYDVDQRLLSYTVDREPLGSVDQISGYVWEGGFNVRIDVDTDADGDADQVTTNTYDDEGRRVRAETDRDLDGDADLVIELGWEGESLVWQTLDADGDGDSDNTSAYEYDGGVQIASEHDQDGDGDVDSRTESFYTDGLRVRWEVDDDVDGDLDRIVTYGYDEAGRTLWIEDDLAADGLIDTREDWVWACPNP